MGKILAEATGVEAARGGRVPVQDDLIIEGHPEIFVIGDISSLKNKDGKPLPGVAQVAMQQGSYASRSILNEIKGKAKSKPFKYSDKGSLATIGRRKAIADLGFLKVLGILCLAAMVVHSCCHVGKVSQSSLGAIPMGLELHHLQSLSEINHRNGKSR